MKKVALTLTAQPGPHLAKPQAPNQLDFLEFTLPRVHDLVDLDHPFQVRLQLLLELYLYTQRRIIGSIIVKRMNTHMAATRQAA
jgi:hypothetical protein